MKGVIFNVLEEMVIETVGMASWNAILEASGSDGIYTSGESYSDEELFALVGEICKALDLPAEAVVGSFGEYLFDQLDARHPIFVKQANDLKEFLLSIDTVIHGEVLKLYTNPNLPRFEYIDKGPNELTMVYMSPRKLCILAEGLIRGAAARYGNEVTINHPICMHNGAENCHFEVSIK
jgi:predicted hydrocarbon binding protein